MKNALIKHGKFIVFSFGIMAALCLVWSMFYYDNFCNFATNYRANNENVLVLSTGDKGLQRVLTAYFGDYKEPWIVVDNFYRFSQKFNHMLYKFSLVMLVIFAITLIAANHSRKKFYKSNLIVGVASNAAAIVGAIVMFVYNTMVITKYNQSYTELAVYDAKTSLGYVDATQYAKDGVLDSYFSISNSNCYITYIVLAIFLAIAVVNLTFTLAKYFETNKKVVGKVEA